MPYQNGKQVAQHHVQALIQALGFTDVTANQDNLYGVIAIQDDDGNVSEYPSFQQAYRTLLQEIALRRVAP